MQGNLLLAIFVLLAATVLLVPLAKWAGLGTILGYLVAGILIGPYGLALVTDTEIDPPGRRVRRRHDAVPHRP